MMLFQWIIIAAVLGQTPPATTQPADARPVVTTQPAPTPPATTQPVSVQYMGPTELSDSARIEVVGDQLVIVGTQTDLDLIQMLIAAMEQAGPAPTIELFHLKNAQAQQLAPSLQRLWSDMVRQQRAVSRPEDQVAIMADELSNTIIVAGTKDNLDRIRILIDGIDGAPSIADEIQTWEPVELEHIRASEAAEIVRQTLEKLQKRAGVTRPSPIDVQIAPNNSLLIIAPQKDFETVRKLIELIDREPKSEFGGRSTLAVFPLLKAEADTLAKTLQEMIAIENTEQRKALQEQIRRLRLVKATRDGGIEELPDLDLEKPIKILADSGMNAIIVGTTESNIKPLGAIIDLLDTQPMADEVAVRIFPLKNADAENMAEVLKAIFDQGKNLAEVPGKSIRGAIPEGVAGDAMAYNVSIATDPRTNTLIVAGQLEQIAFAQKVVDEMDIEGIGVKFPVQVLKLEHADPDRLADVITKLNQQRIDALKNRGVKSTEMERIFVIADPRTESLIISAKDENVKEVRELLQQLDAAPADFLGDIHIITLQNLTATDLGPKIEQLWERRMNLKSKRGETYDEMPVLIADTRSNAIIVASSKEDFLAIEALIKKLEQQPLAPSSEIRVHVLEHNEAGKVGPQLETLFQERAKMRLTKGQEEQPSDRITIVTDAATNTLLIASSQELYDEMVRLLSQLDVPLDVRGVLRLFTLQHADATRAAKMIEDLFTKGIQRSSGAPGSAIQEAQRKVSIVTDTRSNTLIVSATQENFQIVESLLKQIDSEEAPSFTPDTRIFQVSYADAVKVADMMEKLFDGIKQGLPQPDRDELNMTFIPDERSNVVIVTGSRYGMRRAEELFEKIDREPGQPSGEIDVYPLEYSSSAKLAEMLTDLFEQRQKGTTGNKTPLHILPDTGSNSLVVTGSRDDHVMVRHMLGLLDKASSLSQQMEIFPLQKAKADDLANTLTDLLEKQSGGRSEAGFNIAAEPRTNSLVAFAGPDVMTNIRAIIERLDTTKPAIELGMRVIRLKQAKAEELAERLDEFLEKANADNKESAQVITFMRGFDAELQKQIEHKLVHQDITLVPDSRTNSLLVLAPNDSIAMLEMLVEMLDEIKPITAEIQMFWLQNADAEETKDLLEQLFMVGDSAKTRDDQQARQLTFGVEGVAAAAGVTTGTVELAFSVDKRTNMLIAAGSAEYLEIVENIVYKLDDLDVQNRKQRIIKLNNGKAENIAQTMDAYFSAEAQAVETTDAEESLLRKLERQVTIQADEDSNSLLLSYNPRMEAKVIEMVNKLDQAPPQVMIQVLLAEVTLTDTVEMGMEFALQDLLFTEHAVTGPNDTIQGNNLDFVGGTDVGAIGSGSLGGFSFTITGEDFNFLLRALQTEGRLEVLSRPSIMVADNQEANITVGENVPVVERVSVTSGGVVVPQVNYRDVGILLDVEPHINADGYVSMHIMPEISSIGTSSVNVGSGVNLPIFNMRSADTWVTVRDGQTIVIGGLITTIEQEGENKVPIMGDIPWLGPLFRANRTETRKTELLIVLTPKVIRTDEEAHAISVQTRDETGFLDRIRTNPLMEKLQVKPAEDQLGPTESDPAGSSTPAAETEPKAAEYGPVLDVFGPEAHILRSDATIRVAEGTKE